MEEGEKEGGRGKEWKRWGKERGKEGGKYTDWKGWRKEREREGGREVGIEMIKSKGGREKERAEDVAEEK